MDLIALADFNLVASHAGLGRASRASGRSKATLSRRVAELERELGVKLFERVAGALALTEAGRTLFLRTNGLLGEIEEVGAQLAADEGKLQGRLRIVAPVTFALFALGRLASQFARAYPALRLDVTADDQDPDPVEGGFDVVIRVNPSPEERLVGRCFLRGPHVIVASPALPRPVAHAGVVEVPSVVTTMMAEDDLWRLAESDAVLRPVPTLRLSSKLMVREAILAGEGVGRLPRFLVADDLAAGRLVLWGTCDDPPAEIWALHSAGRVASRKVTAFVQFLCDAYAEATLPASTP